MEASIQSRFGHLVTPFLANGIMPTGAYGEAKRSLCGEIALRVAVTEAINAVLAANHCQLHQWRPHSFAPTVQCYPSSAWDTAAPWNPTPLGLDTPLAVPAWSVGSPPVHPAPLCLSCLPHIPQHLPTVNSPVGAVVFLAALPAFTHPPSSAFPQPPPEPPPTSSMVATNNNNNVYLVHHCIL
jgi:hypothetical protein